MYIPQDDINEVLEEYGDPWDLSSCYWYPDPATLLYFSVGIIDDIHDPDKLGRVQVKLPMLGEDAVSDWVPILRHYASPDSGTWAYPQVGETVAVIHLQGRAHHPIVMGSFYTEAMKPDDKMAAEPSTIVFGSRSGLRVEIDDKNKRISVTAHDGKMRLVVDEEKGIEIVNEEGDIEIECDKLEITAGECAIEAEKDMKIEADSIKLESSKGIQLKASQDVKLKGQKISLKGDSGVTAGGKQIAKADDQVVGIDMHTVMVPAGTSQVPTPLPHPYLGKLKDKLSTDVEINGKKAAVKGSKAKFDSPGHFPTPPGTSFQNKPNNEAEITNGCADKVTINGKAAATLGSNATSCDDTGAQNQSTVVAAGAAVVLPIKLPCIDDRTFKQDGGFMFNTRNPQNKSDPSEKEKHPKLSNPKWGKTKAKVGEAVKLSVSSSELYENANVEFTIWKDGADETKDEPVKKVWGKNQGGKAEAEWTWYYRAEDWPEPFKEKPKFYFTAEAFKCEKVKSGTVEMSQTYEIIVYHPDGSIAKDTKYKATVPGGQVKEGTTDAHGKMSIPDIPPGNVDYTLEGDTDYSIISDKD